MPGRSSAALAALLLAVPPSALGLEAFRSDDRDPNKLKAVGGFTVKEQELGGGKVANARKALYRICTGQVAGQKGGKLKVSAYELSDQHKQNSGRGLFISTATSETNVLQNDFVYKMSIPNLAERPATAETLGVRAPDKVVMGVSPKSQLPPKLYLDAKALKDAKVMALLHPAGVDLQFVSDIPFAAITHVKPKGGAWQPVAEWLKAHPPATKGVDVKSRVRQWPPSSNPK